MLRTHLGSVSPSPRLVQVCLVAAAVATIPIAAAAIAAHAAPSALDACAPRVEVGALPVRDQSYVARRVMACADHARGQISTAEYRERIAKLDAAWDAVPAAPLPAIEWASTVRGVSSQYSATSWSAERVLGAPDVYPRSGDNQQAWASLGADTGPEWIEVGYAQPMPISAVKIFETYNPGAIQRVELITARGAHQVAFAGAAVAAAETAREQTIEVACTNEPIVGVRVLLDSAAVPGWNELDAIGIVPCAPQ